ncbi:MED4 [Cordylochernes scorpioides]|uniref:Mediator of RNA polymerase II transcription subunit 4 n=1 Tax=Cordylochernes scorpioides TaxID=51811 RepID=A0ABY6KVM1_9ARAC|nr:MED4 [Cordylochernes scorpioides]
MSTKEKLLQIVDDFELLSKEMVETVVFPRNLASPRPNLQQLADMLVLKEQEMRDTLQVAGEQGEVQKKLDQIQAEIEKQDQDIHHLQRQLKEAEHILSTAIYQAKQKLQAIHKAAERSVSSEELIKYAHRISSCNAIAAPHNWQPGDPRRPYPTDLEMRMGFLGRMSDLSPASGAHLLPPAAPIPTQSAPQDLPPGGRQAKPRYPGEPSSFTWQGQQPPQQPPFQPPTAAAAVEKAAKDNEDVEVMSTDSSSSSSSDSQ